MRIILFSRYFKNDFERIIMNKTMISSSSIMIIRYLFNSVPKYFTQHKENKEFQISLSGPIRFTLYSKNWIQMQVLKRWKNTLNANVLSLMSFPIKYVFRFQSTLISLVYKSHFHVLLWFIRNVFRYFFWVTCIILSNIREISSKEFSFSC